MRAIRERSLGARIFARALENRTQDDQKRIVSVKEAFLQGADYIVVGRPIRNAKDPKAKALEIQEEIASLFEE